MADAEMTTQLKAGSGLAAGEGSSVGLDSAVGSSGCLKAGAGTPAGAAPGVDASAPARVAPDANPRAASAMPVDPCVRAENEDDDGYDPYSDRRPAPEPLFERDPWT